jgi:predicted P-loop ATPase
VSQYLAQLGEDSSSEALVVHMFPVSLTGTTFSWFASLAPSSVNSWLDLEKKFHEHFFSSSNELKLSHLTSVKQQRDEPVVDYFRRFRDTKTDALMFLLLIKI